MSDMNAAEVLKAGREAVEFLEEVYGPVNATQMDDAGRWYSAAAFRVADRLSRAIALAEAEDPQ